MESRKGSSRAQPSSPHHWPRRHESWRSRSSIAGTGPVSSPSQCGREGWLVDNWRMADGGRQTAKGLKDRRVNSIFCRQSAKWASDPRKIYGLSHALIGARLRLARKLHPADSHWPLHSGLLQRRVLLCTESTELPPFQPTEREAAEECQE